MSAAVSDCITNDLIRACGDELGIVNIDEESLKTISNDVTFKTSLILYVSLLFTTNFSLSIF